MPNIAEPVVDMKIGDSSSFVIKLESCDNRTFDYALDVYNADNPAVSGLANARIDFPADFDISGFPDGMTYTLSSKKITVRPNTTSEVPLTLHTSPELLPGTYNIAIDAMAFLHQQNDIIETGTGIGVIVQINARN